MVDSVKLVNEDVIRRFHPNVGKLHKGHMVIAASASIPSKYQTVVIDKGDKKGFLSTTKRFDTNVLNDNPGPGNYVAHEAYKSESTSYSKKGLGGFVSKNRRISRLIVPSGPGPGKYDLPSTIQSRADFNRANMSNFHKPIAQPYEKPDTVPAPNSYKPSIQPKGKVNNVHAGAAFRSHTKRESCLVDKRQNPAPGQYEVNEGPVNADMNSYNSSFKSKADRDFIPKNNNPGPGAYKPNEPIDQPSKQLFPKKHYLCLSAPAMPLPPQPINPGPGAYDLVNYEGPQKHFMSSSMFLSSSSRWHDVVADKSIPGPGAYHPIKPKKESFIYNQSGRWI